MTQANQAALTFLENRRSRPGKTLLKPAPDRAQLAPILKAGMRVPDHGKLEPWRLIVLNADACQRLSAEVQAAGARGSVDPEKIEKERQLWRNAPLIVAVVISPIDSPKIPEFEQVLSAGAVCLSLVNAALASGWGANWLTAFPAFDRVFLDALGLSPGESIAGFIHMGTEGAAPPERPRPDPATKVTWLDSQD